MQIEVDLSVTIDGRDHNFSATGDANTGFDLNKVLREMFKMDIDDGERNGY